MHQLLNNVNQNADIDVSIQATQPIKALQYPNPLGRKDLYGDDLGTPTDAQSEGIVGHREGTLLSGRHLRGCRSALTGWINGPIWIKGPSDAFHHYFLVFDREVHSNQSESTEHTFASDRHREEHSTSAQGACKCPVSSVALDNLHLFVKLGAYGEMSQMDSGIYREHVDFVLNLVAAINVVKGCYIHICMYASSFINILGAITF